MAERKKTVANQPADRRGASRLKPLDNSELRMPTEIRKLIRERQKESIGQYKAISAFLQSACESPSERKKREQVLIRIAKKLGIYEEVLELKSIDSERKRRWQKVRTRVEIAKLG